MMPLLVPLLLGATAGCGAFLAIRSIRPRGLAIAAQRFGALADSAPVPGRSSTIAAGVGRFGGRLSEQQHCDLAILDRDPVAHASAKITGVLVGAAGSLVLVMAAALLGLRIGPAASVPLVLGAAVTGYVVPDRRVRRDARRRRVDVVAALSSYLDLVTVLLAGGAGIETALHAAAESGDGWTYDQLRTALLRARTTRQSVWTCYSDLGRRIGVEELVELSASVQLAGRQGARIAQSLGTRAATLRSHVLSGIEAEAHAASERMGLPTVLMFIGFLFLLGFPAAQIILGSS